MSEKQYCGWCFAEIPEGTPAFTDVEDGEVYCNTECYDEEIAEREREEDEDDWWDEQDDFDDDEFDDEVIEEIKGGEA